MTKKDSGYYLVKEDILPSAIKNNQGKRNVTSS